MRPHISLARLGKIYESRQGPVTALQDINLAIGRSEFISLIGPSGSGKSTLLMIVAGLVRSTQGDVLIAEKPVVAPVTDVGIVFQQDLLFDWRTVLGNVMLQADIRGLDKTAARAKAMTLLERVGLKGFEHRRPWELSGGMRQRAAICRALLHDASILLLDEPFGALDALTRDQMNLDLQELWLTDRPTAILVTHSISEAVFLSDRVIVLSARPGRIAAEVSIDLPRPRTIDMRDSADFVAYQHTLRTAIGHP
ncbi:MAG: ABC transporter ATP-binding protein [Alphaproteobacteria bacterium]|nr:ABC transporter ATP-binding protein [Alphaproteobacteria bacterium]